MMEGCFDSQVRLLQVKGEQELQRYRDQHGSDDSYAEQKAHLQRIVGNLLDWQNSFPATCTIPAERPRIADRKMIVRQMQSSLPKAVKNNSPFSNISQLPVRNEFFQTMEPVIITSGENDVKPGRNLRPKHYQVTSPSKDNLLTTVPKDDPTSSQSSSSQSSSSQSSSSQSSSSQSSSSQSSSDPFNGKAIKDVRVVLNRLPIYKLKDCTPACSDSSDSSTSSAESSQEDQLEPSLDSSPSLLSPLPDRLDMDTLEEDLSPPNTGPPDVQNREHQLIEPDFIPLPLSEEIEEDSVPETQMDFEQPDLTYPEIAEAQGPQEEDSSSDTEMHVDQQEIKTPDISANLQSSDDDQTEEPSMACVSEHTDSHDNPQMLDVKTEIPYNLEADPSETGLTSPSDVVVKFNDQLPSSEEKCLKLLKRSRVRTSNSPPPIRVVDFLCQISEEKTPIKNYSNGSSEVANGAPIEDTLGFEPLEDDNSTIIADTPTKEGSEYDSNAPRQEESKLKESIILLKDDYQFRQKSKSLKPKKDLRHPRGVVYTEGKQTYQCPTCTVHRPLTATHFAKHKRLDILQCKQCLEFYNSDVFSTTDGGRENECFLCGDGGNVAECDSCLQSVCESCINHISGPTAFKKLHNVSSFKCYSCNPSPIKKLLKHYQKVQNIFEGRQRQPQGSDFAKKRHSKTYKRKRESPFNKKPSRILDFETDDNLSSLSSKDENESDIDFFSKKKKSKRKREGTSPASCKSLEKSEHSTGCSSDNSSERRAKKMKQHQSFRNRHKWDVSSSDSESEPLRGRKRESEGHKGAKQNDRRLTSYSPRSSVSERSNRSAHNDGIKNGSSSLRAKRKNPLLSSNSSSGEDSAQKVIISRMSDGMESPVPPNRSGGVNPDGVTLTQQALESNDSSSSEDEEVKKKQVKMIKKGKDPENEGPSSIEILEEAQEKSRTKVLPRKRGVRKRRFIILDSDLSTSSKEEQSDAIVLSDDNGSVSEEETTDDKSHTPTPKKEVYMRRNIRKIKDPKQLTFATRLAQKEEQERIRRLKQKSAILSDEKQFILEDTVENSIMQINQNIVMQLKPHQREGIKFLWDCVCESLERLENSDGSGAILAHCMGLGKTIQVIAFIDMLITNEKCGIKKFLIVAPKNTLSNWIKEFDTWVGEEANYFIINFCGNYRKGEQLEIIKSWFKQGGVGIVSYDTYRILASGKGKRTSKQKAILRECLLDPGPDMVICDEGHLLRNPKSALSMTMSQIQTKRRIILTGTPLQNNLKEYYTMANFVKPNLLGTLKEFSNRFINPISNGQCRDATPLDVRIMKRVSHVLHKLLSPCVQRKDHRVLTECLPGKQEYILKFRLGEVQEKLYVALLNNKGSDGAIGIFKLFNALLRIWNHPWMLRIYEEQKLEEDDEDDEGSDLAGFICDSDSDAEELCMIEAKKKKGKGRKGVRSSSSSSSSTPILASTSAVANDKLPHVVLLNDVTTTNAEPDSTTDVTAVPDSRSATPSSQNWHHEILTDEMEYMANLSGKILFLKELLQEAKKLDEKILVFSQSILTLNVIEHFLNTEEFGNLTADLDYFRLDGSTGIGERSNMTSKFNNKRNQRVRLFMISTRAGSLGINLVSANRIVIFDACWNPSHDLQAVFRAYRYGQTKPVFVYRLIAMGTMEEKIYDRQVTKESLALRVVDKKQIDRHFSLSNLKTLLVYTPPPPKEAVNMKERPEADHLLCGIMDRLQPDWLVSYHSHDSLLIHREKEELSEEEQKCAWDDYKRTIEGAVYYNIAATGQQPTPSALPLQSGQQPNYTALPQVAPANPSLMQTSIQPAHHFPQVHFPSTQKPSGQTQSTIYHTFAFDLARKIMEEEQLQSSYPNLDNLRELVKNRDPSNTHLINHMAKVIGISQGNLNYIATKLNNIPGNSRRLIEPLFARYTKIQSNFYDYSKRVLEAIKQIKP